MRRMCLGPYNCPCISTWGIKRAKHRKLTFTAIFLHANFYLCALDLTDVWVKDLFVPAFAFT